MGGTSRWINHGSARRACSSSDVSYAGCRRAEIRQKGQSPKQCRAQVDRLVDGKLEEIVEVDADINNRGTVAAKRFGQLCRIGDDLCGWMRRGTHADDGILKVNENSKLGGPHHHSSFNPNCT